ncbi:M23 family metallopeptidase [Klenkia sp. PcliD-1-E]|uniref:M23 family metallopeptidase n=1 Tax=Klenkia sp. PcliD-1-E TaxID=2954492 RepID=UPI002097D9FD|nr:M23 family metallopeptidase [Klenkia sp. PcliD-1-E]MCO7218811.1 peptidoglycan DD-metalloendopeptidase family protein [Klenkia sp. PcliD-1-E]
MSQRPLRALLVASATAAAVVLGAGPVLAAPPAPGNPSDGEISAAQTAQDAAAAEVGRIAGLVAAADAQLQQVQVQAEAAGTAYDAAQEALAQARAAAEQTAAQLAAATAQVTAAQGRISDFSRDSYMNGAALTSEVVLLDVRGPGELVQRAAMLEWVANNQLDVLGDLETAQLRQANADSAARQAVDQQAAAERAAADAKAASDAQVVAQQAAYAEVSAQKASYDAQLQAAQVQLLSLQGARNAYQAWLDQRAAEEAAAARAQQQAAAAAAAAAAGARNTPSGAQAGYVLPAAGRTSSCYGSRWGTTHLGVDIAAPIGTPVYAATAGTVQRAGAATGFGQAVYVLGTDGAVTVYGHVSRYYVRAGDRVQAGEQIADVGNEGQSTGPHLHFEVHPSGAMYSGAVDPVPWMSARGVVIRGC